MDLFNEAYEADREVCFDRDPMPRFIVWGKFLCDDRSEKTLVSAHVEKFEAFKALAEEYNRTGGFDILWVEEDGKEVKPPRPRAKHIRFDWRDVDGEEMLVAS